MRSWSSFIILHSAFCILFLLAGCGDVVVKHNTKLDADDLVKMTDQMAAGIAGDPDVQAAIAQHGTLKVVVQPVVNNMTGEILPRGQAQIFTGRVRLLLSQQPKKQFTWILNRDYYNELRATELDDVRGPDPDRVQPEFALTATFSTLTKVDAERRSTYYLCTYEMTDLKSGDVLWADKYELKKIAVKGFLD